MNPQSAEKEKLRRPDKPDGPRQPWVRFTVTGLEADLAYFNARMELIGEPRTINQKAQIFTFKLLAEAMNIILIRLKRKSRGIG